MASLLTIPLELLVAVSAFLNTEDLGALRLACKQVEKSLYEWFSKEFFTKKQFMLTYKSLQAFIDISNHTAFSKKLTHVIIATNVYSNKPQQFRDKEAAALYTQGYQDQTTLLNTGIDRELLTAAFQNLRNLQTVGIRDFNNPQRSRDESKWTSWGATTVKKETGVDLVFTTRSAYTQQSPMDVLARVFQTVIYALGKAERAPPELEILLRHNSLPDSAFDIPDFVYPSVKPVLDGLKKLFLRVDTNLQYVHTHKTENGSEISESDAARLLRRFLSYTPNLEHLRLNLERYHFEHNEQFLNWLSLRPSATTPQSEFFEPPPVSLEKLTKLDLGQIQTRPTVILNVVQRFSLTLRHLELWTLTLSDAPGHGIYDARPNVWKAFFTKIAKMSDLHLDHLKVGMLSQDNTYVQFEDHTNEKRGLVVKEYTGKKMEEFLKTLIDDVFVLWPQDIDIETGSDEDEDEEMADEDDEDELDEDEEDESDEDGEDDGD